MILESYLFSNEHNGLDVCSGSILFDLEYAEDVALLSLEETMASARHPVINQRLYFHCTSKIRSPIQLRNMETGDICVKVVGVWSTLTS